MAVDAKELQERDERIRKREGPLLTQPSSRRRASRGGFLFGVIRSVPGDEAPYVNVQQVRVADDYAVTGLAEFVPDSTREVLCEINTRGGNYKQWIDDSPEDGWSAATVVHLLFVSGGVLFIMHKGRNQYITETGEYPPTDCYIWET